MGTARSKKLQRADTLIYSIMFESRRGRRWNWWLWTNWAIDMGADGYKVLQKMSRETGGGVFEVSRKMGIDAIYKRIEEELRSQYSIGYTPDRPGGGGIVPKLLV